jgi:hypothetical protein
VNVVKKLCIHVCKGKNDACYNYSRNGEEGIKENNREGEFNYNIFDIV